MSDCNCHELMQQMVGTMSGLTDALYPAPGDDWESSEVISIGGPAGNYSVKSPFNGMCQYSILNLSFSAACVIQVSQFVIPQNVFSFTSSPPSYSGYTGFPGFIFSTFASQSPIPVMSTFTDIPNSEGTLYVRIDTAVSNAAYVAFAFRQKRVKRK